MTTPQFIAAFRRLFKMQSPMNVWKKTFTRERSFLEIDAQDDFKFLQGERWKVGDTITIKMPERFIDRAAK